MADSYNVSEVVGKTLTAKVRVKLFGFPDIKRPVIGYVEVGNPVGVVDSYLTADQADGRFWWSFINSKGLRYYTPHALDTFSVKSLQQQGALTVEQKAAKEEYANAGVTDKLIITAKQYLPWVFGALVAVPVLKEFIRKKI